MSEIINKKAGENPDREPTPPALPWMEWDVGDRVVVRYREEDGGLRDALGYLVEREPAYVVIDAKRGRVRVEAETMVVGRKVLPPKRRFKPLPPLPPMGPTSN